MLKLSVAPATDHSGWIGSMVNDEQPDMRLDHIKSISYLKSHAPDMLSQLANDGDAFVITQNGEAKAVLQSAREYEQNQETLALLKILALGRQQVSNGDVTSATDAIAKIRGRNSNEASSTDR